MVWLNRTPVPSELTRSKLATGRKALADWKAERAKIDQELPSKRNLAILPPVRHGVCHRLPSPPPRKNLTRAPIRLGAITQANDGRVSITTPPHPLTGSTVIHLDVIDWIHAICQQIPDHGQHLTRYYGAYSNRTRQTLFQKDLSHTPDSRPEHDTDAPSTKSSPSSASWARLIRKVFEVDPLLCLKCGEKMKIISVITEPAVVDKIIRHLQKKASEDKTATRAPPPTSNLLN